MHSAAPALSVVIPCYNEELVLDTLHERLGRVCDSLGLDYEVVLVNDGSKDGTWAKMTSIAVHDPTWVCVNLSRNHGQQLALTAGLSVCRGDHILVIDADLQDPPEALPEMWSILHREGADVVYGQRLSRSGETWFKRASAFWFYWLLGKLSDSKFPRNTGDFRLMSRRVLDQVLAMPERQRYFRGMVSWIGFKQVPYQYERDARAAGQTNYNVRKMTRFAIDAIIGFSTKPLTVATRAGGLCCVAALVTWLAAGWWWVARGEMPTVGLLAGLVFLLSGGQFLALGIIGEYLGRMFDEVRGRPLFLIDQVVRGRAANAVSERRDVA